MSNYQGSSIVDYLSSVGQDSSYAARAKLAAERGINNYSGTAAQNLQLLGGLKGSPTPALPVTPSVAGGDMASQFTPEQKKKVSDMAQKTGAPTDTEAAQMKIIQAALSPEELAALGLDIGNVISAREGMAEAEKQFEATGAPTTTGLGVLQSALTAKTDEFNREAVTPDMMAAAGITGYGALQSTMAAKQKELDTRIGGLRDKLMTQGQKEADVYNAALKKYEILREEYDTEADRMSKIVQDIMDHEQAIDLIERRAALDRETDAMLSTGGYSTASPSSGGSFKNLVTGTGTITAGANGQAYSPYWKWGLDITGTHDSAILAPFEGEVVFAGWDDSGFGNQVKIRREDGTEVWLSHLNSINPDYYAGAKVYRGDQVGTLGNTGNVIDQGGGGYHVDITMTKPDGSYYDPKQVARFVGRDPQEGGEVEEGGRQARDTSAGYGKKSPINVLLSNTEQMEILRGEVSTMGVEKTKIFIKSWLRKQGVANNIENLDSDANVETVYNAL